ncbi:MAG TPA: hypothetical protein VF403_02740 [Kofleriaceae bacterium]
MNDSAARLVGQRVRGVREFREAAIALLVDALGETGAQDIAWVLRRFGPDEARDERVDAADDGRERQNIDRDEL